MTLEEVFAIEDLSNRIINPPDALSDMLILFRTYWGDTVVTLDLLVRWLIRPYSHSGDIRRPLSPQRTGTSGCVETPFGIVRL